MQFHEKFLYHIWDAQHILKSAKTISGKPVSILSPGRWNTFSGPDFKNSVLKIGGQVCKGDVEVHHHTTDWKHHNHDENHQFNDVILHVVYQHNGNYDITITENGNKIEILELKNILDEDIEKLLALYSEDEFAQKEKFCNFFAMLDGDQFELAMKNLGIERLKRKVKRFSAELYFSSFDQLLYSGIMEALGYSKNKFQMISFANELTYDKLKEFYYKGLTQDQMVAIWLYSSGLISGVKKKIDLERIKIWEDAYRSQNYFHKKLNIDWKSFRIRPVNHPAMRMIQIAPIIYKSLDDSIMQHLLKLFSFPENSFSIRSFMKKLYGFFSYEDSAVTHPIGKARIDTIFINIVLPLIMLYAKKMNYLKLERTALSIYLKYKGLPENHIITYMKTYMDSAQKKKINSHAYIQQALIQLFYDFCQSYSCKGCTEKRNDILELVKHKV